MKPVQILAHFVSELKTERLPDDVVAAAKRHMLDTLGVGLRGAREATPRAALKGTQTLASSPQQATVWADGSQLPVEYAALANGAAAHVLDFDDTHTAGIVHGSAILVPLVLALGEQLDASGQDVIVAFVAGWEVAARIGIASQGTMHERGYHTSSTAGVFGAAAAAAKLMGLTTEQICHAMALSGSLASGINEYQSDGSSSKIVHIGWAAHAGIVAAHLARAGMTGPASVFEGRLGFLNAYGDLSRSRLECLTANLGEVWEMARVSIKPYSCCHFAHAFIDCAIRLKERGVTAEQVESMQCLLDDIQIAMVCEPLDAKRNPITPYGAKFSLPFMVSIALLDGEINADTFTKASLARQDVQALAQRFQYRRAKPGETTFPKYFPALIHVTLRDGSTLTERMDINAGTPENPLSDQALDQKFMLNVTPNGASDAARALLASVRALEHHRARDIGRAIAAMY
jgi:2-methylcitrate dehydratase PrpD